MAKQHIKITYKNLSSGGVFSFYKSPLAVLGISFCFVWLLLVFITALKITRDLYFPFEGKVLKIETRWYDRIAFEFSTWEHLIIETPDGKIIDRLISLENRLPGRIQTGDYITKKKGFASTVRPRDKRTTQELIEKWKSGGR